MKPYRLSTSTWLHVLWIFEKESMDSPPSSNPFSRWPPMNTRFSYSPTALATASRSFITMVLVTGCCSNAWMKAVSNGVSNPLIPSRFQRNSSQDSSTGFPYLEADTNLYEHLNSHDDLHMIIIIIYGHII